MLKGATQTTAAKNSENKGRFQPGNKASKGPVQSDKAILVDAIENGKMTEKPLLDTLKNLASYRQINEQEALRLLRIAVDTKNSFVTQHNLQTALGWKKRLEEKLKGEKAEAGKTPVVAKTGSTAQLLAERNAIIQGKTDPKPPATSTHGEPSDAEKIGKPIHPSVAALVDPKDEYKYRYARTNEWQIGYRIGGRQSIVKADMSPIPAEYCRAILNIVVNPIPVDSRDRRDYPMRLVEREDSPYWIDARTIKEETPEWLKQWTGFGTSWQWPEIPEPEAEAIRPPNEYEKIVLPPVTEGWEPQLPGENQILRPVAPGSVIAAFKRNRKFEFEETGHVGNAVIGNVIAKSEGIGTKVFPKIRQAHFTTWQKNNFAEDSMPGDMREAYKTFLQSLDSIVLPTARTTLPDIEPYLADGRSNPRPVQYPSGMRGARRWGTKADDAKKQRTPTHRFGENPGADLAAMLEEAEIDRAWTYEN